MGPFYPDGHWENGLYRAIGKVIERGAVIVEWYNKIRNKKRMKGIYRSRRDIIIDILRNAIWGIEENKLRYFSNLSSEHFKLYLNFLLDRKLLEKIKEGEKIIIKTTTKGINFLHQPNNQILD